jgi:L-fuconolactonase
MLAIDSHHHIWNPFVGDFSWMTREHDPINREFTPEDLIPLLAQARVSHTVLVQTWSSLEETEAFLTLAASNDFISGVVGWMDLTGDVSEQLTRLYAHPHRSFLKGVRHQVHNEDDANWLMQPNVQKGLRTLAASGLAYDLLIRPREIPAAISCVEALPDVKFIVNHIAKPRISEGWDKEWEAQITQLASHHENVWIKLSGLVTEADWGTWKPQDIRPYVERVLALFGTKRVMVGSDWPVCTLASSYSQTMDLVRDCITNYTPDEQSDILRNNAIRAYGLDL